MADAIHAKKQFTYSRHKPEETVLYKIIQNNWLSFQAQVEQDTGYPLPDFVIKEFEEYLHCGILAHGFLRAQCQSRYIARPAVAEERLSTNDRGEVIYKFKKPWDDGTTAIKMTPMELMEKLAALVPRPRVHLTRFHGVLGPHYKYRKQIVPKKPQTTTPPHLALVAAPVEADKPPTAAKKRISWARLLKRVFNIDVSICAKCKGQVKIIAAIEDPKVIKKILAHLGLPSSAPRLHPARGPPITDQGDMFAHEFYED